MPDYKLVYFNFRGLGEVIRQMFYYADVPFEDVRLDREKWCDEQKLELGLEWGQLPILFVDGQRKAQTFAICRYVAKKFNLVGANECEEFRCDEIVEAIRDYSDKWWPLLTAFSENDWVKVEELKKTMVEVETPLHLGRFNALLEKKGNTWLVGDQITYADFILVDIVTTLSTAFDLTLAKGLPAIEKLIATLESEPKIKAWLDRRPKTKL